jgi:hypothetical protein
MSPKRTFWLRRVEGGNQHDHPGAGPERAGQSDHHDGPVHGRIEGVARKAPIDRARQTGMPHSGNHRSSSGSIGSSSPICALSCSSRSVERCWAPPAGTNGYQLPRLKL